MPIVTLPDNRTVEFPEDASQEAIEGALRQDFPQFFAPVPAPPTEIRVVDRAGFGAETEKALRREQLQNQLKAEREDGGPGTGLKMAAVAAGSIEQGLSLGNRMAAGVADLVGIDRGTEWQKWYAERDRQIAAENAALGADGVGYQLLGGSARAFTELPAQLMGGAAGLARNAAVKGSAIAGGIVSGLSRYNEERASGDPRLQALGEGLESGVITGITTRAFGASGVESVFKNEGIRGVRNRLLDFFKQAGLEGSEEWVDQVQQDLSDRIHNNPTKPIEQSLKESLMAFGVGGIVGGGVSGVQHGYQAAFDRTPTPGVYPTGPLDFSNPDLGGVPVPASAPAAVVGPVEAPAAAGPVEGGAGAALFKGKNGEAIRVDLGGATLEQAQAAMFRQQPGAEFVGMEPVVPKAAVPVASAGESVASESDESINSRTTPAKPVLTYDAFAKASRETYARMMRYSPDEVGSGQYAGEMGALADAYPEWAARVEAEIQPPAARLRSEPQQTLIGTLNRRDFTDVSFGRLDEGMLERLNEIRQGTGQPWLTTDELVVPANVVRKLYDKRMLKDGMTATQVADLLYSIFHSHKSKAVPSKEPHIQALVNMRESLSRLGFIGRDNAGRTVIKSGYQMKTPRLVAKLGVSQVPGGPTVPPSGTLEAPRQTAGLSDVQNLNNPATAKPEVKTKPAEVLKTEPAAQPGVAPTGAEPPALPNSGQPTVAQAGGGVKVKKVRVGKSLASRFNQETLRVGNDILEFIREYGGMMSKAAAKARGKDKWKLIAPEYDDARPLSLPWHNLIYRGRSQPDTVAQAAYTAGVLAEPSVPALWQAISNASRHRRSSTGALSREEKFMQEEEAAHGRWAKATVSGKFQVTNEQLAVGDVLDVEGVKVEVTERDPETGRLTLQDGREFETQYLEDGQTIYVEAWVEKPSEGGVEFLQDEPLFGEPETVEQQKARLAQEQARREAKEQQEQLAMRQAAPLAGTAGDLGQGDIFGGGDLFAPPAPPAPAPKLDTPEAVAGALLDEKATPEAAQGSAIQAEESDRALADFGEKLGGARKDLAKSIARDLSDAAIARMSLAEIWPKSEVAAIEDKDMAALAQAVRSIIPSKPRQSHKLARWVERVKLAKALMGIARERGIQAVLAKMPEYRLQSFADKITLLRGVDRAHWERLGEVHHYPDAYSYGPDGKTHIPEPTAMVAVDGKRRIKSDTLENLIARVNETLSAAGKPEAKMQFEVRGLRDGVGGFFINKAGDPLRRKLKTFETADEALKFKRDPANYEVLAQAWEEIKATDNVKETDVRRGENRPRTGADHRRGQDATPELFLSAFGFRGVEFGNWVSQGASRAERQGMLNASYDALMDLANVVGIPPKAISLNGTLGLGLGSRGHGWGSAHYEPDTIVINLTKTRGAGSLAHEWFHALDNYFQRHRNERGIKAGQGDYITNHPETYYEDGEGHRLSEKRFKEWADRSFNQDKLADWKRVEGVRPEVAEAFAELVQVLNASPMAQRAALVDKGKSDGYWSRIIERAARSFENYTIAAMQLNGYHNDYLANVVSVEDFARDKGRYPYLLPEEVAPVAKAFSDLFGTVRVVPDTLDAVDAETRQRLAQMNLKPGALYANPFLDPKFWGHTLVSGARMLRELGQFTATRAQWGAAMVKRFGARILQFLDATWTRLMRLQNQQANGVGAAAQGHLNQIEVASGVTNIAEEQKSLPSGNPGLLTALQPQSAQIAYFGGKTLLAAKQQLDVTGALQAAAVKKQSDALWQQLVEASAKANPLSAWKLPAWLIGSPRARAFKKRVLHIAARLNASGRATDDHFAEPPLAPGMVRLYRGESGMLPERSKLGALLDPEQYRGRWFTTDKDYAARYAKTATEASGYRMKPADNGALVFLDVAATTDLNQFAVPAADRWRTSLSGSSELILPAEMLGQAKRLKWSRSGNFTFADFTMRAGTMSPAVAQKSQLNVGDSFTVNDPITGVTETLTLGPLVTTPEGRVFHQLTRPVAAATQAELYQHFATAYPEMIWFLDLFIDPALAGMRQTINGIEVPVFNRFAAATMMPDGNPNFTPLTAYTPDVLVTRSLLGSIRGALSFRAGNRSPGRKYKTGTSREGGHVRDLLSGFNVRTWQMLQERSRREWMQAVLATARPIPKGPMPVGWDKLETGMEELWQAVKRLRNWQSPTDPATGNPLFPETEQRLAGDGSKEWKAFFGEAAALRGKQRMLPKALVEQIVRKYAAQREHGRLIRLGAWLVRNSTQLFLAAPVTVMNNVLTNDLFTLEAATRRLLSASAGRKMQDLRFARELFTAEFFKWFPGLRTLVDPQWRQAMAADVLPENLFADQTMLADLKVRLDEDPLSSLRQGELGAAALQFIKYGSIDVRAKRRMAYAWLRAQAVTNARKAGLRGAALKGEVDRYLANPPVADVAQALAVSGFELLNYADSPAWLEDMASGKFRFNELRVDIGDYGRLVLPFPRFGYHFIAKNAKRAAALKLLLGKVPKGQRADAFADLVTFLMWPAGGLGILAAYGLKGLGDDDDEARKRVGTASIKTVDAEGNVVSKTLPRDIITSNRINLSAWARSLGLGTEREEDFWLRVRSYPVVAMAGAAILAEEDARKFGAKEGALTYGGALKDLAMDFFSVGMLVKVPVKVLQDFGSNRHDRTLVDPYAAGVPTLAYAVDQTLDSVVPGTRQFDIVVKWMDPIQRRRSSSKTLGFEPEIWDAARVGHMTGVIDRLFAGKDGTTASTLPPEGAVDRRSRSVAMPQEYTLIQRYAELSGFNVRPINRQKYEHALAP